MSTILMDGSLSSLPFVTLMLKWDKLKMNHMMQRESVRHCGLFFISPTKRVDISMTCTIKGRRFQENCMSFALNRAMLMPISLPSGKRNGRYYQGIGQQICNRVWFVLDKFIWLNLISGRTFYCFKQVLLPLAVRFESLCYLPSHSIMDRTINALETRRLSLLDS